MANGIHTDIDKLLTQIVPNNAVHQRIVYLKYCHTKRYQLDV